MNSQKMIEALLPTDEAYIGVACTNCMEPSNHLVTCSACKLVKYCNKVCQKKNWKKHKPVCKILQMYKQASVSIPDLTTAGSNDVGRIMLQQKFHNFKQMVKLPPSFLLMAGLDIPPSLKTDTSTISTASKDSWKMAEDIVMRSPFCSICKTNQFEFQQEEDSSTTTASTSSSTPTTQTTWKRCPKCNYGCCCSNHYNEYQSTKHTPDICQAYMTSTEMSRFRYNHTIRHGDRFMFVPEGILTKSMTKFPNNWKEYFQLRCAGMYSMRSQVPKEFFPASTFLLSQPVTCLYGMYQHNPAFFTTTKELTIHVVGAGADFELEGGAPTCIWEEIMHCLPAVKTLRVIFIGPNSLEFPETNVQCCPDCVGKNRSRIQGFSKSTYHDYFAKSSGTHSGGTHSGGGSRFKTPDLIVAFNTGMFEEYTDSWKESLEIMLDLNVPCIFTSYNNHEACEDLKVLKEVNAHTLRDLPVKHPFAVDFPIPDLSAIDQFFQHNMYSNCFKGRNRS